MNLEVDLRRPSNPRIYCWTTLILNIDYSTDRSISRESRKENYEVNTRVISCTLNIFLQFE